MQIGEHTDAPSIERLLVVVRSRWWIILLATLLVGAATLVFSERQTKLYTATASIVFQEQGISQEAAGVSNNTVPESLQPAEMATNVKLVTSQTGVAAGTARLVGHGLTGATVARTIAASEQGTTAIVDITATYRSPSVAAMIANVYTTQFIRSEQAQQQTAVMLGLKLVNEQIAALSHQQLAGATGQALLDRAESLRILAKLQDGGVQLTTRAGVPTSPSSPKTKRDVILGLLLGLLIGLAGAFLVERFDRRMKDVDEVGSVYRLPLLAAIPHSKQYALPPHAEGMQHRADTEVFKLLRAYLRYFNVDRELRVLLVASASPGDGKSTISRNLAEAAQETGTSTLLLEADFRRPSVARHYRLQSEPGLAELLIGSVTPADAVQSVPIVTRINGSVQDVSLDVLVAGHSPPNPAELVQSHAMTDTLSWATEHYKLVVIDTPPLAVVSDAISLLHRVDGVVLVSAVGKNTRDAARFLRQRLEGVKAPLLGVVANGVKARGKDAYEYGYGQYGTEDAASSVAKGVATPVGLDDDTR